MWCFSGELAMDSLAHTISTLLRSAGMPREFAAQLASHYAVAYAPTPTQVKMGGVGGSSKKMKMMVTMIQHCYFCVCTWVVRVLPVVQAKGSTCTPKRCTCIVRTDPSSLWGRPLNWSLSVCACALPDPSWNAVFWCRRETFEELRKSVQTLFPRRNKKGIIICFGNKYLFPKKKSETNSGVFGKQILFVSRFVSFPRLFPVMRRLYVDTTLRAIASLFFLEGWHGSWLFQV